MCSLVPCQDVTLKYGAHLCGIWDWTCCLLFSAADHTLFQEYQTSTGSRSFRVPTLFLAIKMKHDFITVTVVRMFLANWFNHLNYVVFLLWWAHSIFLITLLGFSFLCNIVREIQNLSIWKCNIYCGPPLIPSDHPDLEWWTMAHGPIKTLLIHHKPHH